MIYLIDDKINRQMNAGWDLDKFKEYEKYIVPIHTYSDMKNLDYRKSMFSSDNVILFHESFFHNEVNTQLADINDIRNNLEEFAKNNPSAYYVSFSGSNSTRNLQNNAGSLPVNILYQNLEYFISSVQKNNKYDISFLFYGENHTIEKELLSIVDVKIKDFDQGSKIEIPSLKKILFLRSRVDIQSPFGEKHTSETIFNKDIEDIQLNEKIEKWFGDNEYDFIFLPICFGATLSDFNGLRLATHIRCTKTQNRLKPIFIYSFAVYPDLIKNEYFNILRTKNIFLINYDRKSFKSAIELNISDFDASELSNEMQKLKLDPPQNYFDNHSIANEWGVYQMARNANVNISEVSGFDKDKLISAYFKWLITINKLDEPIPEMQIQEQKKYAEELSGIKILGKIDLSKFKK